MKVLITGGSGQLGKALYKKMKESSYEVFSLSKKELDITGQQIEDVFQRILPNYVFHCAAYTAVDNCEDHSLLAFNTNAIGTLTIAQACKRVGATLVYISSDYVFDGKKRSPYIETDEPNPLNIYGLSKWMGEELVQKTLREHYIVRTSWLYGHGGKNFVNTMRSFALRKKQVPVVDDQLGAPTYVCDLVDVLIKLIDKPYGIYHVRNEGECSWYQFAQCIYEESGSDVNLVEPTSSIKYKSKALRPSYSLLDIAKLEENKIPKPRHWKLALREFLKKEGDDD
ncbi:dTDP-4-dehydrorhamnose reductase [Alkalihalobacterium bogoriense]|uniref:dTDP-4-dehydrorhamnose reductase n=1 Tax=Alkalihalobacterium bogoriense TaxID=246272 RepID=UPI000684EC49|nr:dTDP-4-dehydrorhamnose reductase [Alkalihalobacterium bogoriense]